MKYKKIYDFLKLNGWKEIDGEKGDYRSFYKKDSVGVDVGKDEIVFLNDSGDYAHIPLNYYALVGFIYVNRLIVPKI